MGEIEQKVEKIMDFHVLLLITVIQWNGVAARSMFHVKTENFTIVLVIDYKRINIEFILLRLRESKFSRSRRCEWDVIR